MFNPAQDWPVYVLIAVFFSALILVFVKKKDLEKKNGSDREE